MNDNQKSQNETEQNPARPAAQVSPETQFTCSATSDEAVNSPESNGTGNPDSGTEIVGVKFKKNGKTYYFSPSGFNLKTNEPVIVDTSRGEEYGITVISNRIIKNSEIVEPLRSVVRLATDKDTEIHSENVRKEVEAFNNCIALIDKHSLDMKLIDVELAFDRSKLLFYFSSEGRVDFRELVKDLASIYHMRIEMRQIGIRDEAKILGGLGICGRPYCCHTFLSDFAQVSVKMAKEQNLSLNSAKISGACGRLMCCLRYEYDTYLKEKELTPKVGLRVMTADGAGTVTDSKPMTGIVKVKLDSAGEDSEPVIFLRNDVVPESDYHGQKLTKTDTRDKKTDKDDAYIFSLFESEKADPDTGNTEQEQVSNPVQKDRREQTQKKNHKQRSGVFSSNTETPEKPQKEIAEKNKTNESSSGKPFRNKNKMNPGVQTNNAQTQNRDTKKQDPKKKKKFFKPYFRQNKKNKDEK